VTVADEDWGVVDEVVDQQPHNPRDGVAGASSRGVGAKREKGRDMMSVEYQSSEYERGG